MKNINLDLHNYNQCPRNGENYCLPKWFENNAADVQVSSNLSAAPALLIHKCRDAKKMLGSTSHNPLPLVMVFFFKFSVSTINGDTFSILSAQKPLGHQNQRSEKTFFLSVLCWCPKFSSVKCVKFCQCNNTSPYV